MDIRPSFDKTAIHSVELNLLDGQVDLILRSLELYSYNLEFMLNAEESDEEKKREKLAQLKYTYEQVLSSLAEQVNGKAEEYEKMIDDFRTHYFVVVDIANGHMKSLYAKCKKYLIVQK